MQPNVTGEIVTCDGAQNEMVLGEEEGMKGS